MKYFLDKWYWNIKNRVFPQNDSIRKAIPSSWADADFIIEEVLFAVLIRWVDEEDGLFPKLDGLQRDYEKFKQLENKETEELLQHFEDGYGGADNFLAEYYKSFNNYLRLKEAYYWALYGRQDAEKKLRELVDKMDMRFPLTSWNKEDQEYLDYTQWMEKEHDKHLTAIFELRGWLWT